MRLALPTIPAFTKITPTCVQRAPKTSRHTSIEAEPNRNAVILIDHPARRLFERENIQAITNPYKAAAARDNTTMALFGPTDSAIIETIAPAEYMLVISALPTKLRT